MRKLALKDAFAAVRLIKQLNFKDDFKELLEINNDKAASRAEVGSEVLFKIMEKAADHNLEEAVYQFLAGPLEVEPDTVAMMELTELINSLIESANVEEWKAFFKRVSALTAKSQ